MAARNKDDPHLIATWVDNNHSSMVYRAVFHGKLHIEKRSRDSMGDPVWHLVTGSEITTAVNSLMQKLAKHKFTWADSEL